MNIQPIEGWDSEALVQYLEILSDNDNKFQRKGQAMFNVLDFHFPEVGAVIRGTAFDPFYDDYKIPVFFEMLSVLALAERESING